jgi:hypothetical protein
VIQGGNCEGSCIYGLGEYNTERIQDLVLDLVGQRQADLPGLDIRLAQLREATAAPFSRMYFVR